MPTNETGSRRNGIAVAQASHDSAGGIVCILVVLPVLLVLLAVVAWLCWVLANGLLGTEGAALTVLGLVVCAAEFSWRTGRGFGGTLIMAGFTGVTLLTAVLFGVAGYKLICGG
jgi:hypothetical protein